MPKTINPIKKQRIKEGLLSYPPKSTRQILKEMQLPASVVNRSTTNKCVKVCMDEIKEEFKLSNVTEENVLRRLDELQDIAIAKGDIASAVKTEQLKGNYLMMFGEKRNTKIEGGNNFIFQWKNKQDETNLDNVSNNE